MPISKENRALYPPNWSSEIVPRIRERDGDRCKFCGVAHHAIGYRRDDGSFVFVADGGSNGDVPSPMQRVADEQFSFGDIVRLVLIVLTCAHLHDHGPRNCDDGNLAMLCQRCHNRLDAPMRAKHAAATRKARNAAGDFFT